MLTFAAAVFFLIVTPGPGVLSLAGVGSGFGAPAGRRYLLGLFLGNNLVFLAVASGVAALILTLLTDHQFGVLRVLPYSLHLAVDGIVGVVFGFIPARRAGGLDPIHALVVEDSPPYRSLVRSSLEEAGHRVTVAENGLDAVCWEVCCCWGSL